MGSLEETQAQAIADQTTVVPNGLANDLEEGKEVINAQMLARQQKTELRQLFEKDLAAKQALASQQAATKEQLTGQITDLEENESALNQLAKKHSTEQKELTNKQRIVRRKLANKHIVARQRLAEQEEMGMTSLNTKTIGGTKDSALKPQAHDKQSP